ncbi:MAG: carbohydrate ABC transporter permease [Paenibacillaceae bacterium]|nr:carbohydrate ABC transporter permease [Paenibacillaceae bacterium]
MGKKGSRLLPTAAAYLLAVLYLFPVFIAILNSFKDKRAILVSALAFPTALRLDNYRTVLTTAHFGRVFVNSVLLTAASVALILAVSAAGGYALARWRRRAAGWLMLAFMSSMFVPFHTIMITLVMTAKEVGATGHFAGLVAVYGGLMCPLTLFLYRGFVKSLPIELEESGIIDGCGTFQLLLRIVLPLLLPITATVAVLNAMWIWNDFLLPYLILAKPLTVPLSQMYFYGKFNQQWHLIMAGFVVSTLPLVAFFLLMHRFVIKGLVAGALKT